MSPDMNSGAEQIEFVAGTVLKRDAFSETVSGHAAGDAGHKLVLRKLSGLPWYSRWFAWVLARREIRGLRAVQGIVGTPALIRVDRDGLLRDWSAGTPLNLARPAEAAWYRDARRLIREMRRRGVTHNDLAKPQNWLMTPEGLAAVIDFQLARVHARRNLRYRLMAYEDLRHLLKQKKRFAPGLLTATERRVLAQRSLPGRIWRRTGKRFYKFVTRKLFHWSDGEGTEHRATREGPAIRAELLRDDRVRDLALSPVPLPGRGVGLYGFAETDLDPETLRGLIPPTRLAYVQPVAALPREGGALRQDVLELIALNRLDELEIVLDREPELRPMVEPIRDARLNLSDRILRGREAAG
ncbi:serine/threonine protein kinase [Rhodobacterales bacterium HKCCE2091]|nr:serine/threonine protein kinase [Rhodobacterales bacterium HKCCE2091]